MIKNYQEFVNESKDIKLDKNNVIKFNKPVGVGNNFEITHFLEAISVEQFDKLYDIVGNMDLSGEVTLSFKNKFGDKYELHYAVTDLADYMKKRDKEIDKMF